MKKIITFTLFLISITSTSQETKFREYTTHKNKNANNGSFDFNRDVKELFRQPADDIFLIKLSYRLGR